MVTQTAKAILKGGMAEQAGKGEDRGSLGLSLGWLLHWGFANAEACGCHRNVLRQLLS